MGKASCELASSICNFVHLIRIFANDRSLHLYLKKNHILKKNNPFGKEKKFEKEINMASREAHDGVVPLTCYVKTKFWYGHKKNLVKKKHPLS